MASDPDVLIRDAIEKAIREWETCPGVYQCAPGCDFSKRHSAKDRPRRSVCRRYADHIARRVQEIIALERDLC